MVFKLSLLIIQVLETSWNNVDSCHSKFHAIILRLRTPTYPNEQVKWKPNEQYDERKICKEKCDERRKEKHKQKQAMCCRMEVIKVDLSTTNCTLLIKLWCFRSELQLIWTCVCVLSVEIYVSMFVCILCNQPYIKRSTFCLRIQCTTTLTILSQFNFWSSPATARWSDLCVQSFRVLRIVNHVPMRFSFCFVFYSVNKLNLVWWL